MNQYTLLAKLGEGAFSTVYQVKRNQDAKQYAMKKIKIMNLSEKEIASCLNEVRILASLQHPNILTYKDSFYDEPTHTFCIVTQLLEGGDILKMIQKHKSNKKPISEALIWKVAFQILKALSVLHDMNILHRDIKSANIFFAKEYKSVILADLNVSIVTSNGMATTQTGTPYYASPEVWMEKPYSSKCDIWSLGCVLYEMAVLRPPFMNSDLRSLKKSIISGVYKRISQPYSAQLDNFIHDCLVVDPRQRKSANELLESQYFKSPNFNQVQMIESISLSSRSSQRILQKIYVPKKRNFKSIRELLPKHRFDTQASMQKNISNKSIIDSRNKQNAVSYCGKQQNKKQSLPAINGTKSSNSYKLKTLQRQRQQSKSVALEEMPRLPKKPLRC